MVKSRLGGVLKATVFGQYGIELNVFSITSMATTAYNQLSAGGGVCSNKLLDEGRMRIVMLAAGTYGDVPPCVAFGLGLQQAGHQVCIASYAEFEDVVTSRGL